MASLFELLSNIYITFSNLSVVSFYELSYIFSLSLSMKIISSATLYIKINYLIKNFIYYFINIGFRHLFVHKYSDIGFIMSFLSLFRFNFNLNIFIIFYSLYLGNYNIIFIFNWWLIAFSFSKESIGIVSVVIILLIDRIELICIIYYYCLFIVI